MTKSDPATLQQRSAARRTAFLLGLTALGVYAVFIYLGATR